MIPFDRPSEISRLRHVWRNLGVPPERDVSRTSPVATRSEALLLRSVVAFGMMCLKVSMELVKPKGEHDEIEYSSKRGQVCDGGVRGGCHEHDDHGMLAEALRQLSQQVRQAV